MEKIRTILYYGEKGHVYDAFEIDGIVVAKFVEDLRNEKTRCYAIEPFRTPWKWDNGFSTLIEAKKAVLLFFRECKVNSNILMPEPEEKKTPVKALPSSFDSEFYPTPKSLGGKLIGMIDWKKVRTVLEPSAGKGDLVEALMGFAHGYGKLNGHVYYRNTEYDIDCIEKDENLRFILEGKKYRVVADDFLLYTTRKCYDVILMNPPFSNGDEHLLRAIEMQEQTGGQIACILNAETLLNPYSNRRKVLIQKLRKYDARIDYVKNAFSHAERKTDVTVALVYINIPREEQEEDDLYTRMKRAYDATLNETGESTELAPNSKFEALLRLYQIETAAVQAFFNEYNAVKRHITTSDGYDDDYTFLLKIGSIEVRGLVDNDNLNSYMLKVRSKYWYKLFNLPEITNRLTSSAKANWDSKVRDLCYYEFSEFNVRKVMVELQGQLVGDVESAIMNLFEKLSCEHSYNDEFGENIHYYNGWKTNKAHKVNNRVIIPAYGAYSSWGNGFQSWDAWKILEDIEKSLDYLNGRKDSDTADTLYALQQVNGNRSARNIRCKYFTVTFFKKGTCHIKFHPEAQPVLDALNIFAARNRGWLPPSYGKVRYSKMDKEEQKVVDEFQGKKAYDEVMDHPELYLFEKDEKLLLA